MRTKFRLAGGVRHDFLQKFLAEFFAQIQAQLRQFERNIGVQMFLRDTVENRHVSVCGAASAVFIRHVFAQQIQAGQLETRDLLHARLPARRPGFRRQRSGERRGGSRHCASSAGRVACSPKDATGARALEKAELQLFGIGQLVRLWRHELKLCSKCRRGVSPCALPGTAPPRWQPCSRNRPR